MSAPHACIDSHVHLDLIERHHPRRIDWLRTHRCTVVSWAYFEGVGTVADLRAAFAAKACCLRAHAAAGMPCRYLAGVHPRSIPAGLAPEAIEGLLQPYLDDPLCLGIGEIGLETGDAREREVFLAQLDIGRRQTGRGKVVGVHTPRSDKPAVTAATLAILEGFADLHASLVVDHCTGDTIGAVLDAGFWAGVTVSPVKTPWEELKRILAAQAHRCDRIMGNTDSGSEFHEHVVRGRHRVDLAQNHRERLFHGNAARFFGLPGSAAGDSSCPPNSRNQT